MRNKLLSTNGLCAAASMAILLVGYSSRGTAQSTTPAPPDPVLVEKGIAIAPVSPNLTNKDRNMVGWGSYLVNAMGGCNDCHTNPSYTEDGDPFKGKATKINTKGYLAGGMAFGPFTSRNITPKADGTVSGGLSNFKQIMKTGQDLRQLHPQISPLLQVMPWPLYTNLVDRDLDAIYAYLSSIPCIEGGPGEQPNRCSGSTATTQAVAAPRNSTVVARELQLDGTQSTSADGKDLTYLWSIPQGSPSAAILRGSTATPTVQFSRGRGPYTFQLTVTDSKGTSATDTIIVNYFGQ
jgi:hypothetical protein